MNEVINCSCNQRLYLVTGHVFLLVVLPSFGLVKFGAVFFGKRAANCDCHNFSEQIVDTVCASTDGLV